MKAEVEVSELLALRERADTAERELRQVKQELAAFSKEAYKGTVLRAAWQMWDAYMTRVASELGMKWNNFDRGEDFHGLDHWIGGENPWDSPKLSVDAGVIISKEWQSMFVRLGIKREIKTDQ